MRRGLLILVLIGAALGLLGLGALTRSRMVRCASVPVLGRQLMPNADLSVAAVGRLPEGWSAAAPAVELRRPGVDTNPDGTLKGGFDLDGDDRSLQLIGIANYVETPPVAVEPGQGYCFAGRALTDSDKRSTTRVRLTFRWLDAAGAPVAEEATDWQTVALWTPESPPHEWSPLGASFPAPPGAASLRVRIQPSSDDRVYLDTMRVQRSDWGLAIGARAQPQAPEPPGPVAVQPWPNGYQAALSFSFDWETAMGGLVHSRSVEDPNADQDPLLRGMRMREGVTTTLAIFRPYGIHATYYANGYNFLLGNEERRVFMGNPTFRWATEQNGWNDTWASTPWFYLDPFGTVGSDPAWYFGDLVPLLLGEGQDIQSHTFSHLSGSFAGTQEWQADLAAWREVAAEQGVPEARSLAFPWSSSGGMSDDGWRELASAGITSVTRTNTRQPQFQLADRERWRCRPVPGHETILACPDFYLTARSAPQAIELIDQLIAGGGVADLWAHTEEVVTPDQIAAWSDVVRHAAAQRDAGKLWIAPLADIAEWQQALQQLQVTGEAQRPAADAPLVFRVTNGSSRELKGVTLQLPFSIARYHVDGTEHIQPSDGRDALMLDLEAGRSVEVTAWPA